MLMNTKMTYPIGTTTLRYSSRMIGSQSLPGSKDVLCISRPTLWHMWHVQNSEGNPIWEHGGILCAGPSFSTDSQFFTGLGPSG